MYFLMPILKKIKILAFCKEDIYLEHNNIWHCQFQEKYGVGHLLHRVLVLFWNNYEVNNDKLFKLKPVRSLIFEKISRIQKIFPFSVNLDWSWLIFKECFQSCCLKPMDQTHVWKYWPLGSINCHLYENENTYCIPHFGCRRKQVNRLLNTLTVEIVENLINFKRYKIKKEDPVGH